MSGETIYGIIGKFIAVPGSRDELIEVLIVGSAGMPGCKSYIVAKDTQDPDGIWITEVWDNQSSHQASLKLPQVKAAIEKGRPLIAGFGERFETEPVDGARD